MLDRIYSTNIDFEMACLHCGDRTFIGKHTELGKWLRKEEQQNERALNGLL